MITAKEAREKMLNRSSCFGIYEEIGSQIEKAISNNKRSTVVIVPSDDADDISFILATDYGYVVKVAGFVSTTNTTLIELNW